MLLVVAALAFASCGSYVEEPQKDWTMTDAQRDSVEFREKHHYGVGANFVLQSDSMILLSLPVGRDMGVEFSRDSSVMKKGAEFVVADVFVPQTDEGQKADSAWLMVASDNVHLGWVEEQAMLDNAAPVSPISQFLSLFRGERLYILYIVLFVAGVIAFLLRTRGRRSEFAKYIDTKSYYAYMFHFCVATMAMFYATMQLFAPDVWQEYYFNPFLNPVGEHALLFLFLSSAWLTLLAVISALFDLIEKFTFATTLTRVVQMTLWGGMVYVLILLTVPCYVGYLLYVAYLFYVGWRCKCYYISKQPLKETT